ARSSLEKLGTEYVDLLLVHWPEQDVPIRETMRAFRELKDEGKIRAIGVSNFEPRQLEEALETEPDVITDQVEMHPFLHQNELHRFCREHGPLLTAYSPLARGRVMGHETLQDIAERYDRSEAQVALRWLLQKEQVITIPKASTPSHIRDNFGALDFELDEEAVERIDAIQERHRCVDPGFAPW
ncbi:MAG: aldo/keto reductase, partial [Candidatus Nanohaloarchaea archaeon]|nr:aldo/keto reductase [Candidatus Nanohaloarchaea archaeon]